MTPYYDNDGITLYQGDCLDIMPQLIVMGVKVDATITDIPYGTTACSWDQVIPFVDMWRNIKALNKPKSATVLFSDQPFTSFLVASNPVGYKYDWIWKKDQGRNFQLAKTQPLKITESINVFCDGATTYNPQGTTKLSVPIIKSNRGKGGNLGHVSSEAKRATYEQWETGYPNNILEYTSERGIHPTRKPVALMQYLIRTYTNPGDTVLDFTCGSGTTLLAAKLEGRKCIGIERDTGKDGECLGYCEYAVSRLAQSCIVFV